MRIPTKVRVYLGVALTIVVVSVYYLSSLRDSIYEKAQETGMRFNMIAASENLELIKSYFSDYEKKIGYFVEYPHRQREFPDMLETYVKSDSTVVDGWYNSLSDHSSLWVKSRKNSIGNTGNYTIGPYRKGDTFLMDIGYLSFDKSDPFILGITVDLKRFHQKVAKMDIRSSNYLEILDENGRYIYHPEEQLIGQLSPSQIDRAIVKNCDPEMFSTYRSVFSGFLQSEVIRSYRVMHVGGQQWLLIGNTPKFNYTEFLSAIERNLALILILFLICVLSIVMVSWFFSDREHKLRLRAEESLFLTKISEERKSKELAMTELQLLKTGLDPHFVFNSLSSLIVLIPRNPVDACTFAKRLSNLLRYQLSTQMKDLVTLKSELKFANDYFAIQKLRFGERVSFDVDVLLDEQVQPIQLPPASLQLLVENALKHNIATKEEPLKIEIFKDGDFIVVRNNLNRRDQSGFSMNLGHRLMRLRYKTFTLKSCNFYHDENYYISELPIIREK
ncbi:histidine kinase [Halosquirtibacter xylanolyticus]|uniref:histidine kinase n=1 Tax=Halosquirtibacter xylanolyticus TaxID=3374599 RepID=UPI003747E279|nr:histidine kinase [Prolixibacteraceae bacterium]